MTEWEQILASRPSEAPFVIRMNTNSNDEAFIDIPTKLDHKHGWHVVGLRYTFEGVDPTTPILTGSLIATSMTLQIQRGLDSEVLLPAFGKDTLIHHNLTILYYTSGLHTMPIHPIRVPANTVTRCQQLRALFRTSADLADISLTTIQLSGMLLYHLITAPDDGRTKLGINIDEI
jgi:hypothetical protein